MKTYQTPKNALKILINLAHSNTAWSHLELTSGNQRMTSKVNIRKEPNNKFSTSSTTWGIKTRATAISMECNKINGTLEARILWWEIAIEETNITAEVEVAMVEVEEVKPEEVTTRTRTNKTSHSIHNNRKTISRNSNNMAITKQWTRTPHKAKLKIKWANKIQVRCSSSSNNRWRSFSSLKSMWAHLNLCKEMKETTSSETTSTV